MLIQGSLRVTCGCEQEQDKDVHVQSAGTGGGDSGGDGGTSGDRTRVGGGVGEAGSSKSRSEKTGLGSFFLGTSSAAVRTSRALEDDVTGYVVCVVVVIASSTVFGVFDDVFVVVTSVTIFPDVEIAIVFLPGHLQVRAYPTHFPAP